MGKAYLAKLTRWGGLVVVVIALGLPAFAVQAGEMVIKARNIQSKSETSWKQIGDDENHGVGAYESIGLTLHENGDVSTYTNKGTYESKDGIGKFQGFVVRKYPDGSTTTSRYEGNSKPAGEGLRVWEGTSIWISGTGKFEGVKGEGAYKGTRYPNKMSVTDWEAKVSLPD